jgi:excinuclease ABC subunit A
MTVDEAVPFFEMIPKIYRKVKNNSGCRFRLHYAGTAKYYTSGGEAQRIKLAELSKKILETHFIF